MNPVFKAVPLLVSLLATSHALAAEPYTQFDGFNASPQINIERWLWTERDRNVSGGKLQLQQRDLGS